MMMVMILIMIMIVTIKTAAASVPGSEMEIKPGVETSSVKRTQRVCDRLSFGVTQVPSNISSDTQCL